MLYTGGRFYAARSSSMDHTVGRDTLRYLCLAFQFTAAVSELMYFWLPGDARRWQYASIKTMKTDHSDRKCHTSGQKTACYEWTSIWNIYYLHMFLITVIDIRHEDYQVVPKYTATWHPLHAISVDQHWSLQFSEKPVELGEGWKEMYLCCFSEISARCCSRKFPWVAVQKATGSVLIAVMQIRGEMVRKLVWAPLNAYPASHNWQLRVVWKEV